MKKLALLLSTSLLLAACGSDNEDEKKESNIKIENTKQNEKKEVASKEDTQEKSSEEEKQKVDLSNIKEIFELLHDDNGNSLLNLKSEIGSDEFNKYFESGAMNIEGLKIGDDEVQIIQKIGKPATKANLGTPIHIGELVPDTIREKFEDFNGNYYEYDNFEVFTSERKIVGFNIKNFGIDEDEELREEQDITKFINFIEPKISEVIRFKDVEINQYENSDGSVTTFTTKDGKSTGNFTIASKEYSEVDQLLNKFSIGEEVKDVDGREISNNNIAEEEREEEQEGGKEREVIKKDGISYYVFDAESAMNGDTILNGALDIYQLNLRENTNVDRAIELLGKPKSVETKKDGLDYYEYQNFTAVADGDEKFVKIILDVSDQNIKAEDLVYNWDRDFRKTEDNTYVYDEKLVNVIVEYDKSNMVQNIILQDEEVEEKDSDENIKIKDFKEEYKSNKDKKGILSEEFKNNFVKNDNLEEIDVTDKVTLDEFKKVWGEPNILINKKDDREELYYLTSKNVFVKAVSKNNEIVEFSKILDIE